MDLVNLQSAATLTALYSNARVAVRRLSRALTVLGRGTHADIRLSSESVQPVHAAIIHCEEGWQMADLSGTGATRIGPQPIRLERLADGDEIALGRFRFRFNCTMAQSAARELPAFALNASSGEPVVVCRGLATFGTAEHCDIRTTDSASAAIQGILALTSEGPLLRNLGSVELLLNGRAVTHAICAPNDRIAFGGREFQFSIRQGERVTSDISAAIATAAASEGGALDSVMIADDARSPLQIPLLSNSQSTVEQLIAARLPNDLRGPRLTPTPDESITPIDVNRAVFEADRQLTRDLDRLERVQQEIAWAADQLRTPRGRDHAAASSPDRSAPSVMPAGPRETDAGVRPPLRLIDRPTEAGPAALAELRRSLDERERELAKRRIGLDAAEVALRSRTEQIESRQTALEARERPLRDAERRMANDDADLRRRRGELAAATAELETARRDFERRCAAQAMDAARSADQARLLDALQSRVDADAQRLQTAQQDRSEQIAQLERLHVETTAAARRLARLRARTRLRLLRQRVKRRQYNQTARRTEADVSTRETRLARAVGELELRQQALAQAIGAAESSQAAARSARDVAEQAKAEYARRVAGLAANEAAAAATRERISDREAELARLQQAADARSLSLTEAERDLADRRAALDEREQAIARRLDAAEATAAALAVEQTELSEQRHTHKATRLELEQAARQLQADRVEWTQRQAASQAEREAFAGQRTAQDAERLRLAGEAAALAEQRATVERERQAAHEAQHVGRQALEQVRSLWAETETERERLRQKESEIQAREQQVVQQADSLAAQEAQLRADLDGYEQRVGELIRQQEELRNQREHIDETSRREQDRLADLRRQTESDIASLRGRFEGERSDHAAGLAARDADLSDRLTGLERQQLAHVAELAQRFEHESRERRAALERELSARQDEALAALAERRRDWEQQLESQRRQLDERCESLRTESENIRAERERLDAARAEFDRQITDFSRQAADRAAAADAQAAAQPGLAAIADVERRIELHREEIDQRAARLAAEWQRFRTLQAEFDRQQREWAEQRDEHAKHIERQRAELTAMRRSLETSAAGARPNSGAHSGEDAPHKSGERTALAVGGADAAGRLTTPIASAFRASRWWGLLRMSPLVMLLAGVIGYVWTPSVRSVVAELRLGATSQPAARSLRAHEEALSSPVILSTASGQLSESADYFDDLLKRGWVSSQVDAAAGRLLLTASSAIGSDERARHALDVWTRTYEARRKALTEGADDAVVSALRQEREPLAASLAAAQESHRAAQNIVDADATEQELGRLRAWMTDVNAKYEKARGEVDAAMDAWTREQAATDEDAARVVDSKRIAAARQADAVLAADEEQLASQAQLLQGELSAVDASVRALSAKAPDILAECESQTAEAARTATGEGVADALDRVRSAVSDYRADLKAFQESWTHGTKSITSWKAVDGPATLLDAQQALEDSVSAAARKMRKHFETMDRAIDVLAADGEDLTQRTILQNKLAAAILPLKETHGDLILAASEAGGTGNRRVDAYRRAVKSLNDRVTGRYAEIQESVTKQVQTEWGEHRDARLAAVRKRHEEATRQRETVASELTRIQNSISDLVQKSSDLEKKRQLLHERQSDVDAARNRLAVLDGRIAEAARQATAGLDGELSIHAARPVGLSRGERAEHALMAMGCVAAVACAAWVAFLSATRIPRKFERP